MPISRWWSRQRGLPAADHDAWVRSLDGRGPARILAWAPTVHGFVVGSPAVLSFSDASSESRETSVGGDWRHVGWHDIEHGGWNAETRELSWAQYGGRRGKLTIPDPARLPELFRERVAASIVAERFVPVRGERGITVSGRRDLGPAGGISWHASLNRGITWSTPGAQETAEIALEQLQQEFSP